MLEFTLDIRTLSFITVLFAFVYGIGLLAVASQQKEYVGVRSFALGILCLSLGFLLLGFRASIPNWLSIIAANALIFYAFALMNKGLAQFFDQKLLGYYSGIFMTVVLVLLFTYFTYGVPSVIYRIAIISFLLAVQTTMCAWDIVRGGDQDLALPQWMAALPFLVAALFFVFRTLWVLSEGVLHSFMTAGTVHQVAFLVMNMLVLTTSFGLLWLISTRLAKELRDQARIDTLTRVYNRRALGELAPREVARAKRHSLPFSIIMADIDHFKSINDTYGHLAGDMVLASFASILSEQVRNTDVVVRYGGEEFLILLPDTSSEQAVTVAEKIRKYLKQHPLHNAPEIRATSSFGTAQLQQEEPWDQLVDRADQALYLAKKQGRDRVVAS